MNNDTEKHLLKVNWIALQNLTKELQEKIFSQQAQIVGLEQNISVLTQQLQELQTTVAYLKAISMGTGSTIK